MLRRRAAWVYVGMQIVAWLALVVVALLLARPLLHVVKQVAQLLSDAAKADLSQAQSALVTALAAAALALLGNWSIKSRELRNARADRMAAAALEYVRALDSLETMQRHQNEVDKELDRVEAALDAGDLDGVSFDRAKELQASSREQFRQMTAQVHEAGLSINLNGGYWLSRAADRAMVSIAAVIEEPGKVLPAVSQAHIEIAQAARTAVTATRSWWGVRIALRVRFWAQTYKSRWVTALEVIATR